MNRSTHSLTIVIMLAALVAPTAGPVDAALGIVERLDPTAIDATAVFHGVGSALASSAGTMFVGAPGHDIGGDEVGAVLVFERDDDDWKLLTRLVPMVASTNDRFGSTVAAYDGRYVITCSPNHRAPGASVNGFCTIFEQVAGAWQETATIAPPSTGTAAGFGGAAAFTSSDELLIGASGSDAGGLAAGAAYVYSRSGGNWQLVDTLVASDGQEIDSFGTAIAAGSSYLAVGAPDVDSPGVGSGTGAIYIFERSDGTWTEVVKIAPDTLEAGDGLGRAVGATDDLVVAGIPGRDGADQNEGAILVAERDQTSWSTTIVTDADGLPFDELGSAVATDGVMLFAGAPTGLSSTDEIGRVVVFQRSGASWEVTGRIMAPGSISASRFGESIALIPGEPGSLLVGAPEDPSNGARSGSAHLFESGGGAWFLVATLREPGSTAHARFGRSVSFTADVAVIGAAETDHSGLRNAGAAYVFRRDGVRWIHEAVLLPGDPGDNDLFGISVVTDGSSIVVGAWAADNVRGAVYVFDHNGVQWSQTAKLVAADRLAGDALGFAVDIDGDRIVTSAKSGSRAYLFELDSGAWNQVARLEPFTIDAPGQPIGSVAIDGDLIVLGSRLDPAGGAARIYEPVGGNWIESEVLRSPEGGASDLFGDPVRVDGDALLVGAPGRNASRGAVWAYRREAGVWQSPTLVEPAAADTGGLFGVAHALGEGSLIVGAPGADASAGRVILFEQTMDTFQEIGSFTLETPADDDFLGAGVDASANRTLAGGPGIDGPAGEADSGAAFLLAETASPAADFSWTPVRPLAGEPVRFRDRTTGVPASWQWDFGSTAPPSAERDPGVTFDAPGEYAVNLTVVNDRGTNSVTRTVEIADPTVAASFAWSPAFPVPGEPIRFTDTSAGAISSWSWDFGDGGGSTLGSPEHVFADAGTYDVMLSVDGPGGSDSVLRTIEVGGAGGAGFDADVNIAAVARLQGAGAFFTSRIDVFNAHAAPVEVDVVYTSREDIALPDSRTILTLTGRTLMEVDDSLGAWFGFADDDAAAGSLRMRALEPAAPSSVLAQSVVIARNDDGTEYGQFFPAVTAEEALVAGSTAYLASTVDASTTRVNLGAMALEDGTTLRVTPVDPVGTPLAASRQLVLTSGGNGQINDLDRRFDLTGRSDYLIQVDVDSGTAIVYASVLDGNSGSPGTSDPTTILPVTTGSDSVTLLELGPIVGFDEFSGSASVTNLGAAPVTIDAAFHLRGQPGVAASATLPLDAGETAGFLDLVGDLFGLTDVGTVVLTAAPGSTIAATGREFAILRDGDVVVGTAGQLIPGMTPDNLVAPGRVYHLLGLRQLETDAGIERSHVAAFNPGDIAATLEISLYDEATGQLEGATQLTIRPGELVQRNNIVRVIGGVADGSIKRLEVVADGPVYLKGFRVNRDADPITIDALPEPAR